MAHPAETHLYRFLDDRIRSAEVRSILYELELHDTVFQTIKTDKGVRISEATGDLAPAQRGGVREFNTQLTLVCYARVKGDSKQRQEALHVVFAISRAVTQLIFNNPTLDGRVCDVQVESGSRGYDELDGKPYAVANIPLLFNAR